jgi:hypothetical protein
MLASVKAHSGAVLLLGGLTAASGQLLAQSAGPSISYSSSAECPDERQFRDQLALHLRSAPDPLARPIAVEAQQLEQHSIARVKLVDDDGLQAVRELSAPTCAEVVTAAALVVALAIDSRPQPEKPPATPPPAQTKRDAQAPSPLMDEGPAPAETPTDLFFQFGAGAVVHIVVTPEPMLGAAGFVGLGKRPTWDLRGTFVYAASGTVTRDARAAEFSLLAGRLDGCGLTLVKNARFALDPCLAVELGALHSAGIENERYTATEQTTFWLAAGPLLRGQAIFDSLRLEAYAGPWFPIVGGHSFVFTSREGDRSFQKVPLVGVLAGLNLSYAVD